MPTCFDFSFKNSPNLFKNRFQDASLFRSISASIFRRTKTTKVGPRRRPRRQDGPKKLPKTVPRGSQKTDAHPQFSGLAAKSPSDPLRILSGPHPDPLRTRSGPSPDPLRNPIFGPLMSNTPAKLCSGEVKPLQGLPLKVG